eukprot:m.357754 g.357754  ORF g.357754 m.357754 type:complete len:301 (-) comp17927_c0_seq1:101-1003(-)
MMRALGLLLAAVVLAVAVMFSGLLDPDTAELVIGKRVLLCGASEGIGEEMAVLYAQMGAKVVITARRADKLQRVVERAKKTMHPSGSIEFIARDLADEKQAKEVIAFATKQLEGIDVLVLNHVKGMFAPWSEVASDLEAQNRSITEYLTNLFAVNTFSYASLATHALPALEVSGGVITVVSSAAGQTGLPFVAPYSSSKHALHGFFNSLRQELIVSDSKVSITLVPLGNIDTDANSRNTGEALTHLPKASPADAGNAVIWAGAHRVRQHHFPWSETRLSYVLSALFPETMDWITRAIVVG